MNKETINKAKENYNNLLTMIENIESLEAKVSDKAGKSKSIFEEEYERLIDLKDAFHSIKAHLENAQIELENIIDEFEED